MKAGTAEALLGPQADVLFDKGATQGKGDESIGKKEMVLWKLFQVSSAIV